MLNNVISSLKKKNSSINMYTLVKILNLSKNNEKCVDGIRIIIFSVKNKFK